jgi:hypothetical protein
MSVTQLIRHLVFRLRSRGQNDSIERRAQAKASLTDRRTYTIVM